jgi:hypothetical protein
MLFTAGLLNRLRWRCILAGGDLAAAAAAHDRQTTATSRRATRSAVSMGGASSLPYRSHSDPPPAAAKALPLLREGPPRRRLTPRTGSKILEQCGGCEVGAMAGSLVSGRSSPRLGAERPGQSVQVGSEEQSRWSLPLLPFPSFSFWANGRKRPLRDPETIRPRHTPCYRSNRDQRPLIRGLLGRH